MSYAVMLALETIIDGTKYEAVRILVTSHRQNHIAIEMVGFERLSSNP